MNFVKANSKSIIFIIMKVCLKTCFSENAHWTM